MKTTAAALALALVAAPAAAETYTIVANCQLPNGEFGQMVTQTEVLRGASGGLVYPGGSGSMPVYIPDGDVVTHHVGVFRSPSTGENTFTGEGAFINFGHRGPVFQVIWYSQNQYGLRDAYGSNTGEVMCVIQSVQ